MTAKIRVSAVSAALVIICGLEFLVIHPAADPLPVPVQPLPLVAVAWVLFAAAGPFADMFAGASAGASASRPCASMPAVSGS